MNMATCTFLEEPKNIKGRKECYTSPDSQKAHLDTDRDSQIAHEKFNTNSYTLSQTQYFLIFQ